MTRPLRMILTTFLHQSENLQILKLSLWLKSPLIRLLGLTRCQLESLRTACWSHSFWLRQTSMLLIYLQHSQITPIPKQGNHELPNNNRPISLLPALSKVCERVAYNQFVTYLTTKERLTTKQSSNKKWFSTETSLIHTTDAFLKGIDDKKLTACVLLDMSKAFDSVDQQTLLRKIQSVGTSTSAL